MYGIWEERGEFQHDCMSSRIKHRPHHISCAAQGESRVNNMRGDH